MIIKKEIYELLLKCPQVPPEIGGILGGKDYIIDNMIADKGKQFTSGIKYVPNVDFINRTISTWNDSGIDFYGMFHTHSQRWTTLSCEDKKYIEVIMKAMPNEVESLFFPLVFPGCIVKAFRAVKNCGKIYIVEEETTII